MEEFTELAAQEITLHVDYVVTPSRPLMLVM